MILYVDHEHPSAQNQSWGKNIMAGRMKIKYRVEEITGDVCLIMRYDKVSLEWLQQFDIRAILISGSGTDPEHYAPEDLEGLAAVYRSGLYPVFGLCGGWQFMAQSFGATITPMGALKAGDSMPDTETIFRPGYRQEFGFAPVRIDRPHPLFEGLGDAPKFWMAHYMEIRDLPEGFSPYMSTDYCQVQFAAHETLPLYGSQFHPEHYSDENTDGKQMLRNFFRLHGII
jgi:GMP synthase (glutamine-hydrolysing)